MYNELVTKMGLQQPSESLHHHHPETLERKPQKMRVMKYPESPVVQGLRNPRST